MLRCRLKRPGALAMYKFDRTPKLRELESVRGKLKSKKSGLRRKSRDNGSMEVSRGKFGPRLAERKGLSTTLLSVKAPITLSYCMRTI